MNAKVKLALSYLGQGLSVIPVWSPKMVKSNSPNGITKKELIEKCKLPLVAWKEYQTRLPTKQEVTDWFTKYPDANIAIVTGKVSNLVVFDFDKKDAEEYAENAGGYPITPVAETGKGIHVYMAYPDFEVRNSVNTELGLDIRADGGYIVTPPSIHGNGNEYTWRENLSIDRMDLGQLSPWMKEYLLEKASEKKVQQPKTTNSESKVAKTATPSSKNVFLGFLRNGVAEPGRNDAASILIGHLLKKNNPDECWEIIKDWNKKNTPPIEKNELRTTFNSIKNLEQQNKKSKEIDITSFLDTPEKITADIEQNYYRVPFAGDNLTLLENKMNGGLIGGRLYLLGGVPSSGKTVLLNNIADNICLNGFPILFFSYDDGSTEIRYRSYARLSSYDINEFNNNKLSAFEINKIYKSNTISKIRPLKYVVDRMIKVNEWVELIDKVYKQHKKRPVVIVDYLRKLRARGKTSDERLRIDNIIGQLTDLAKAKNIPIMVISELQRESYKDGQNLRMTSFKESGSIEYEASWLGILSSVKDGNVDLMIFKAKRGTGEARDNEKVLMKINKDKMTVADRGKSIAMVEEINTKPRSKFSA